MLSTLPMTAARATISMRPPAGCNVDIVVVMSYVVYLTVSVEFHSVLLNVVSVWAANNPVPEKIS